MLMHMMNTSHVWNYYAEKSPLASKGYKKGSYWPRGKMLGGCSSNNAMIYVRGNSRDYDRWEELGNPTWSWKDVLPYFKKSEDNGAYHIQEEKGAFHGIGGPLKVNTFMSNDMTKLIVVEAAAELGLIEIMDVNSDEFTGYCVVQGTIKDGKRYSTAKAFLNPAKDRKNLHIIKHAHVTKINIEAGVARGVTFDIGDHIGKDIVAKTKKEVVLSAGALNTPQILKLSGVGPKEELGKFDIPVVLDSPFVGENLQDHVIVPVVLSFHKSRPITVKVDELMDSIYSYFRYGMGPIGSIGSTDLVGFVNTQSQAARFPDIQYHHFVYKAKTPDFATILGKFEMEDYINAQLIKLNNEAEILIVFVTLLNPKSHGNIKLRSANPYDPPVINANYLEDHRDVATLIRGIRYFRRMLTTQNFKDHEMEEFKISIPECDKLDFESDSYWECYVRYMSTTIYHPVGTAKMGPAEDPSAVLDSTLKLRGVDGLRVVDASIMPNITPRCVRFAYQSASPNLVPEARVTHTTPAVSPTAIVTPDDRNSTPFRCGNCRSRRRHFVPRNIPVATITAIESASRYNPSTPETRQSGGLVHRSPGSVNKPRSVEAEGEERVRVRARAADREHEEQKKAFRSGGVCPGCVEATTTATNPSPFRHLLTLPHCALQTPRCVRFAYQSASPSLGAGSPCDPHDTRSVPYGDRHARRSQLYTVPVWELPVATPPFCSEEHSCRDHNRHRIYQPLQPVDAGNQAIRWTCPPKSWVRQQTQERRGRRRGEGPSTSSSS
ncbi:hypothetical protein quinque_001940 [Culex quinquefasciatus]